MNKKQARNNKAIWNLAISEGRVVRFQGLGTFRSYATPEDAVVALLEAGADGIEANLVPPALAQPYGIPRGRTAR